MKEYDDDQRILDEIEERAQKEIFPQIDQKLYDLTQKVTKTGYVNENMAPLFGKDSYENQFPYDDFASIYAIKTEKLPNHKLHATKEENPHQYDADKMAESCKDYEQWADQFHVNINQKQKEAAASPYFKRYVRDYFKNPENHNFFEADDFAKGYDEFQADIQLASQKNVDLVVDAEEASSLSTIQQIVKAKIDEGDQLHFTSSKPQYLISNAANLIIAETICGKAAKATFFNGLSFMTEQEYDRKTGNYNDVIKYYDKGVAERISTMKEQLYKDPLFQETICTEGMTLKNVYDTYKAKVNQEINKSIRSNNASNKSLKSFAHIDKYSDFLKDKPKAIDDESFNSMKEIYDGLEEFNKDKKPSDEMKALMDNLKDIVKNNRRDAISLSNLNDAALKYYDKRQGVLFYPFTKNGKARFGAVEKLARITSPKMEKLKSEYKEFNKNRIKEIHNQAGKQMKN